MRSRSREVALVISGIVLVSGGIALAAARLDAADKWGSVLGGLAGIAGLAFSGVGAARARRSGGQSVGNSVVGGSVVQVRNVRGGVRIGAAPPVRMAAKPSPAESSASPTGDQVIDRTSVAGPIRQVDDVTGDVDIDRWD
ncbi:hypothetical protein KOI35_39350 [Actinoplanes bogorensis]|uniref:Uncharacterized protein n=1 Tax=Paractinoplanes bogorensis TaxID=1610840 RepID=A0ABS5Z1K1_9ACTN|nr:hypothetical protein [Actinoplanes bogorensis]